MEKQLKTIIDALAQLNVRCDEISNQQASIEDNLNDAFGRLHEVLELRKIKLISHLHEIAEGKLKGLGAQKDQVETIQARLCSCLDFTRESLKTGSQGEILMMKATTVKQVKELTTVFQANKLKPNAEADMLFSALPDITVSCQNYGQVLASGSPDPQKCYAEGIGLEVAEVGKKSTDIVVQGINFMGEPSKESIKSLDCEIVSKITGIRWRGDVERKGSSQYSISYQPTIKGRHQLHIS